MSSYVYTKELDRVVYHCTRKYWHRSLRYISTISFDDAFQYARLYTLEHQLPGRLLHTALPWRLADHFRGRSDTGRHTLDKWFVHEYVDNGTTILTWSGTSLTDEQDALLRENLWALSSGLRDAAIAYIEGAPSKSLPAQFFRNTSLYLKRAYTSLAALVGTQPAQWLHRDALLDLRVYRASLAPFVGQKHDLRGRRGMELIQSRNGWRSLTKKGEQYAETFSNEHKAFLARQCGGPYWSDTER